uniref:Uncharacterized protein n=1 Tax=Megaselia scalaris TaxID=36166 RepID=T1GYW9_MEGSC
MSQLCVVELARLADDIAELLICKIPVWITTVSNDSPSNLGTFVVCRSNSRVQIYEVLHNLDVMIAYATLISSCVRSEGVQRAACV